MIAFLLLIMTMSTDPFIAAERAYEADRFNEAKSLYMEALSDMEMPSGPLLYNLGNCAFRSGQYAEAILHYSRARLRMPRDEALEYNLFLTQEHLGLTTPNKTSLGRLLASAVDSFTHREILFAMGALQLIGLAGLIFHNRTRRFIVLVILCILISWAGAAHLVHHQWIDKKIHGIVLNSAVTLRDEPHPDLEDMIRVKAGQQVHVEELSDQWIRVEHEGFLGWTERADIGIID